MATADEETPVTYFANPFLRCTYVNPETKAECRRRAVGMVGSQQVVGTPANAQGQTNSNSARLDPPSSNRNWPCYHEAARVSVCDSWTSTTGCQHEPMVRAQHSNVFTFEGTRR